MSRRIPLGRAALVIVLVGLAVAGLGLAGCARTPARTPASGVSGSAATTPAAPPSKSPVSPSPSPAPSIDGHAPAGFVDLSEVDPTIITDIRYATAHNFVGRPVAGYLEPRCLLTRQAAQALHRVQLAAKTRGLALKVYDCYRPARAGRDFAAWSRRATDQKMKAEFYPNEPKSALIADGYIGLHSRHSSGGTVDLTLVPLPTPNQPPYTAGERLVACTAPKSARYPDNSIDMGTGFDCFDSRSHTTDRRITGAQHANRLLLRRLMTAAGFTNNPDEWWHYDLAGPYSGRHFDFPVARAALS